MSTDANSGTDPPDIEILTSLDGLSSGRFVITTQNGTRHLVDLDERTVIRRGTAGREWGRHGMGPGSVTPDGLPMRFTHLAGATVGERMYVANDDEWRLTSTVSSIERVHHPSA